MSMSGADYFNAACAAGYNPLKPPTQGTRPMVSENLLATAPSLERLHQSIGRFYCGMATRLEPSAEGVWNVIRECDGKHLDGVTVRRKAKRFRFEMLPA